MKKFLVMGALAVAVAAVSQQQASAWMNWKFGAGVNMGWQSGGNTWLWGAFRNGQPPGPDCGPYGHPGNGPGYGPAPAPFYFGQQQQQQPMPHYGYQPPPPVQPTQPAAPSLLPQNNNMPAVYRPLPAYNGAYYYPAYYYR